ncbi:MAG: site-specific integrase, partial [Acidobacteriota bacterium]|nr:site-specific integrase [Acidobacteriota bacterium]
TAAAHPELDLLPMMAVCFFSGVRIAEVQRMNWEMIDWDEGEIRLPGAITKTRNPRNIEILEALRAWIGRTPPKQGKIVNTARLRLRRTQLLSLAGVASKRNALRHSFASYHAAKYRDPGDLQLLLGQETPSILFKHYIAATKRSEGTAFFELAPKRETSPGGGQATDTNDRSAKLAA